MTVVATPSCPWVCRIRFCSRVSLCHTINELTWHFLCILSKRRRELVKPGGTEAVFEAGRMPWVGIEDQKGSIAPSSGARGLRGGTVGVQEAPCAGTGAFGCSSREGFCCGSLVPSSSSPPRREERVQMGAERGLVVAGLVLGDFCSLSPLDTSTVLSCVFVLS